MDIKKVREIVQYYHEIAGMKKLLAAEKRELEKEYSTLGSVALSDTPRKQKGSRVEGLAIHIATEESYADRICEIEKRIGSLEADERQIRVCLDSLNSKYKRVIRMRYFNRYSWARISAILGVPDSTIRNWHRKALLRLGEAVKKLENPDEIGEHSSRARD